MTTSDQSKKRASNGHYSLAASKKSRGYLNTGPALESDPVFILVGKEEEKFCVHEHLLTSNSEFFKKALSKKWKEGVERTVNLPETDTTAFRIFAKWAYSGRFFSIKEGDQVNELNNEYGILLTCYQLGDFLQAPDFSDATIDTIIDASIEHNMVPLNLAGYIYPLTVQESTHRKLCLDMFVYTWARSLFDKIRTFNMPREFLEDVVIEIGKDLDQGIKATSVGEMFKSRYGCEYHGHGPDKPCYKTKPAFRV